MQRSGLEKPLLLFFMGATCDLPGNQGGAASGAVVDDQADLDLVFLGLVYDPGRVLDHLRIEHAGDQLVEGEDLGVILLAPLFPEFQIGLNRIHG